MRQAPDGFGQSFETTRIQVQVIEIGESAGDVEQWERLLACALLSVLMAGIYSHAVIILGTMPTAFWNVFKMHFEAYRNRYARDPFIDTGR
jgi:hypothetical protein